MQSESQPERYAQFRHERHHEHQPGHAGDVAQTERVRFHLGDQFCPQRQRPVDHEPKQGGRGHHAEAADLEQGQDDPLTGAGPICAGIHDNKTSHADRRGSRKKGGQPRSCLTFGLRQGQPQNDGSRNDREQEA